MPLGDFAFGQFLDFFHSVKKVSKPRIFCEIICASKWTLVILKRILYSTVFFNTKNFVIFFSFICMVYKWGQDFIGGNFPRRKFSEGAIFLGEKFWGCNFNYNPAHKMEEKFEKSWFLSMCLSKISHIID